jgi:hypothetical protein
VHREATGTSAAAVTAPLALGLLEARRGTVKGAPGLENPGAPSMRVEDFNRSGDTPGPAWRRFGPITLLG